MNPNPFRAASVLPTVASGPVYSVGLYERRLSGIGVGAGNVLLEERQPPVSIE